MAHHFTKAKSQRQNSEKASVAQIVANNNETLSKLIAGEVTKLGFNGKNAKITAFENTQKEAATNASELMAEMKAEEGNFNIKRDILISQAKEKEQNISADNLRQTLSGSGEEFNFTKQGEFQPKPVVEEEPGIQFHSNATYTDATGTHRDALGQAITTDTGVGKTTDEDAFAAIEAIKSEEMAVTSSKAEYIDPHKYNRDRKGQIITNTPAHNQLHSDETPVFVDDSISGNNQKVYTETLKLEKDTKELAIEAKKLADASELQAEKDASNARAQENLDWVAENLKQQKIKESALQRKDDVADRIEKIEKIKERDKKWAEINDNNDKILATQKFADERAGIDDPATPAYEPGVGSSQSQFEIANKRIVEATKESEQDAMNNTTIKDMTTTVREVAAERAKKERKVVRTESYKSQTFMVNGQLVSEAEYLAHRDDPFGDKAAAKLRKIDDGIDAAYQDQLLHEQQINNPTADDIASRPLQQRGTGGKNRGAFRKLQAEKKKAKVEADAAVNASENAFQQDNGAVNVRSMMRGDANDPYSFTTLAYPPDAVNSQENGHFMLFYVNVQDKTKYQYDGLRNGQRVKVGDYIERPGYFADGDVTNVPPALRGANKFISSVEASGLGANAGTTDYQRQIVKNGGPGNILYNNMAVLSKGRKPKSGINSRYPTTTRITDSVALYLPSGIGNTTSASYGDFQTGVAGYLAMSGLDIVSELRNRDFQGAAEKIFGVGGTLITEAAKKLAVAGIETFTGSEGIQQSIDKAFGQTLNPYIEVAFNSTGMRTFEYTFKFSPKSRAETDEVKAIIQLFRFHMLPEMKSAAHRYLTLPSTFDIHYMWQNGQTAAKENSFYNKIATCVLTNVDVNFTPNGQVQSFDDGAPTQIDMSLSFKETEMLTKQHVQEGF